MMQSKDRAISNHGAHLWERRDRSKIEGYVRKHNAFLYEDIVQEMFWTVYQNIRSGKYQRREKASLTSYAFRIARNLVLAENRRLANHIEPLEKVGEDGETYEVDVPERIRKDGLGTSVVGAVDDPKLEWLDEALSGKLTPDERELLRYKFVDRKSWSEIGEIVGERQGALRTRYTRLLRRLRKAARKAGIKAPDQ
jgi:RNA polymerase sigma factor (sigma-70 family)